MKEKRAEVPRKKLSKKERLFHLKQKSTDLKETTFKWSETTDVNSYSKIFKYKNNCLAQTIWLIIFLILTGATFWLISFNIQNYLNYDVTSQTNVIYESPSLFPTVKILF
jgi:hypothetical protein